MFGTYVASQSVMFERSSLLPNIEALYINSPVPAVIVGEKCTATTPLLVYVSFYKNKIFVKRNVHKKRRGCCAYFCKKKRTQEQAWLLCIFL